MKEKSVLLEFWGDSPVTRIIDFFLDNRLFDYTKKQVTEGAGLSKATLFKYWKPLEESGIIKCTRVFGKTRLYKLDESSPIVQRVLKLELDLIKHYAKIDVDKTLKMKIKIRA